MSRSLLKAILTLVGTIIGAGIFALPIAFAQVGFWPATAVFWLMTLAVLATHLMMVDIELSSKKNVRLAGAVRRWLGEHAFTFASISYPCQLIGASVAYLVLGATFLATLVAPLGFHADPVVLQSLFWLGGAATLIGGLRLVANVESWATWFLLAALLFSSGWMWQHGSVTFFASHWVASLSLFGVCLFSLGGIPGIGEVVEIVGRDRRRAQIATVVGTLMAAFVSWIFASSFAGHSLTPDGALLNWMLAAAGFLAVATSYIVIAQDLRAALLLDLGLHARAAFACALGIPLVITYMMAPSVFGIVSVVGTVFGGANGMLVALTAAHVYARGARTRRLVLEGVCVLTGFVYLAGLAHWIWQRVLY